MSLESFPSWINLYLFLQRRQPKLSNWMNIWQIVLVNTWSLHQAICRLPVISDDWNATKAYIDLRGICKVNHSYSISSFIDVLLDLFSIQTIELRELAADRSLEDSTGHWTLDTDLWPHHQTMMCFSKFLFWKFGYQRDQNQNFLFLHLDDFSTSDTQALE